MELIKRPIYTSWLEGHREKPVFKILYGTKGVGKSSVFRLYIEELKASGMSEDRIVFVDLEDEKNAYLLDEDVLYDYIKSRISSDGEWYVFLDEVGKVKGFERILDSLLVKGNIDLYAATSSGDAMETGLGTRSVGRYVSREVLPLSFSEYCEFRSGDGLSRRKLYGEYSRLGSMPTAAAMGEKEAEEYAKGLFEEVLSGEILKRNAARGRKIAESMLKAMAAHLGTTVSAKRIADETISNGFKMSYNTACDYLDALLYSHVVFEITKWDPDTYLLSSSRCRYYFTDTALYSLFCEERNEAAILENLVCLELKRRGYRVVACNVGGGEQLVATGVEVSERRVSRRYFQIVPSLDDGALEKAVGSLLSIRDNYPKYIVTADEYFVGDHRGVITINALDFLSGLEV